MCAKTIYEHPLGYEDYLIPPGCIDETLDFQTVFNNGHPVEIEIGTGKGRFILSESLNRPETNFLGIERKKKWLRIAVLRAVKNPRPNCMFLCLDADMAVKLLIRPGSVRAYHVYFPDPWPKDRHQKRRLFNPRFIEKMAGNLEPQGKLFLKTDHAAYFEEAHPRIADSGFFDVLEKSVSDEVIQDFEEAPDGATHYEIKFRLEQRHIHSAVYQVKSDRVGAGLVPAHVQ